MPKLVSTIKTFVAKTGKKIFYNSPRDPYNVNVAKDIQKTECDLAKGCELEKFTPPYKEVLEQLNVENEQIFRAVVYNLSRIAINRKKYRKDILHHLEEHYFSGKRSTVLQGYLAIKISKIKNS